MANPTLTGAAQENLLSLLGHSVEHGRIIAGMLDPELFEGDYKLVAQRFLDYWKEHDTAPMAHSYDLFADILEDRKNKKAATFKHVLDQMAELVDVGINASYVINTLQQFSRVQKLKDAIYRAAEMLNKPGPTTITQVEGLLHDITRARDFQFNPGVSLDDVERFLTYFENVSTEFSSGITVLDRSYITPFRGGIMTFLAPSGYGKSWFLVGAGKAAMMLRKRVAHVSLENSEEETMMRYYQSLYAIPKRHASQELLEVPRFVTDRDGRFQDVEWEGVTPAFSFDNASIRDELQARVSVFGERMLKYLRIRRFPTRGLSVDGLAAYLDGLEAVDGFSPDIVLIDYPGIMKTDVKNHRLTLGRLYEDLRGLAVERNVAIVAVHQTSKKAMFAREVNLTDAGEDFSVIQTSDIALTLAATKAEQARGLARLMVAKSRQERDKWGILMTQSYATGQFALDAMRLPKAYHQYLETIKGGTREDQDEDADDADDEDDEDE